ncbi:MAG: putative metallo-beta-lactamase superfamily protein [Chthonomonadales bacterium]|nr:putative metallo-beta-lactamase superfamily protein [Chthonomonadales bacterium]
MAPSIWCVRRVSYLTCSYIVKTASGIVLVDAGMDSGGHDMRYALEKLKLPAEEVRAVLLTHWHNDHAAGGQALHEQLGAAIYYHAADAPFLTRATARRGLRGWLSDMIPEWGLFVLFKGLLGEATPEAVAASAFVSDGEILLEDFEVLATPGHTPGHVSYYYRPERALFAGDALAVVGGRVHFMARSVTPDIPEARISMRRLLSLDIANLCPGHRGPLTENVNSLCQEVAQSIDRGDPWPFLG